MLPELYSPNFQAGAELVFTYRETSVMLGKQPTGAKIGDLIDFDLAGDPVKYLNAQARDRLDRYPIKSVEQAVDRLLKIRGELDPNSADGELLRAKISATTAFIRARGGAKYPSKWYIERTFGVEETDADLVTGAVPEADISLMWEKAANEFANCSDLTLQRDGREAWAKFLKDHRVKPTVSAYRELEERMVPLMQQVLGMQERPNYAIHFVSVDDYWINWTGKGPYGFLLQINTHDRAKDRFYRGVRERMFVHEILTHAFQAHSYAENIRQEKINPGYGILVIPGPCQWNSEALAETLPYFIPALYGELSPHARFATSFRLYEDWIYRNAHLAVNGLIEGMGNREQAFAYLMDNLPYMDKAGADRFLEDVTTNPRDISYRLTYGGSYNHWLYAQRLTLPETQEIEEDLRLEFVRRSMEHPRTPSQVERLVKELEARLPKPAKHEPESSADGQTGKVSGLPLVRSNLAAAFGEIQRRFAQNPLVTKP